MERLLNKEFVLLKSPQAKYRILFSCLFVSGPDILAVILGASKIPLWNQCHSFRKNLFQVTASLFLTTEFLPQNNQLSSAQLSLIQVGRVRVPLISEPCCCNPVCIFSTASPDSEVAKQGMAVSLLSLCSLPGASFPFRP